MSAFGGVGGGTNPAGEQERTSRFERAMTDAAAFEGVPVPLRLGILHAAMAEADREQSALRAVVEGLRTQLQTAESERDAWKATAKASREMWVELMVDFEATSARVDALVSALERTRDNFIAAVRRTPVRDMTETLAEVEAALAGSVGVSDD